MDQLDELKKEFAEVLEDGNTRDTLNELVAEDYIYVGREGRFMIMTDPYGKVQHYNPVDDTIIPFVERREAYHE